MLATVRVGERVERCVPFFPEESNARNLDFGIFFVGGGGLGWWQVLLETWRKLAALPFFSSQRSKPGTSRVAGETKAQSIAFINKEN